MILLVVDTQKKIYTEGLYDYENVSRVIESLIFSARKNNIEVVYVCHDDGEGSGCTYGDEGFEVFDRFAPINNEKIFIKEVNSAFNHKTGLLEYLKQKNVKEVIIVGMQTDLCIDATIKSGFENGFNMIIPSNGNTTKDNQFIPKDAIYKYFNCSIWPNRYGKVVSEEEVQQMMKTYDK